MVSESPVPGPAGTWDWDTVEWEWDRYLSGLVDEYVGEVSAWQSHETEDPRGAQSHHYNTELTELRERGEGQPAVLKPSGRQGTAKTRNMGHVGDIESVLYLLSEVMGERNEPA